MFYAEHVGWLAKILAMLNESPETEDYYLDVQVREEGSHRIVGRFSDEIAGDCWRYEANKYVSTYTPRHLRR